MRQILIKGGHLLTMDDQLGEIEKGDILIRDGAIIDIGRDIHAPEAEVIDADEHIVLPGFVDAHRHMWQTQLRARMGDGSLVDYAAQIRNVFSACYQPDDVYIGILMGYLEALNAGCTTLIDHCHIMNTMEHSDRAVAAFKDSGARGIFCYGLFPNPESQEPDQVSLARVLNPPKSIFETARKIRETHFADESGKVRFGLALTELEFFPLHYSLREIDFARDLNCQKISIHAGIGVASKYTRYGERLHRAGAIRPDMHFVHGWGFKDRELRMIADAGASLAATPETELQMAMGFPVTQRFEAAGGKATLGIDIVSNNSADMFTQMRLALGGVRGYSNEQQAQQTVFTDKLDYTCWDVLRAATINGAEALGLGSEVGSLTIGKRADLQLIRKRDINMVPVRNAVQSVVMCANVSNIDTVLVDGVAVKRGGALVDRDLSKLTDELINSTDRILQRSEVFDMEASYETVRQIFPIDKSKSFQHRIGAMIINNAPRSISEWVLSKMV